MSSMASRLALPGRSCIRSMALVSLVSLIGGPMVGPRLAAGNLPPITSRAHHYLVPIDDGRMVYRFRDEGPERVLGFWKAQGREWRVYWDALLDTPRFVYPLDTVPVSGPEPIAREPRPEFVRAVEDFVDANADFLGASSRELADPFVYAFLGAWVLVFQQTTEGGIPLRGASLRVVVHPDGTLGWIRGFVVRGVKDPVEDLAAKGDVESAAALGGGRVISSELQMGFPGEYPATAAPIWSLGVADASGEYSEHIVNARTGELLARRIVEKRLDGKGGGVPDPPPERVFAKGFVDGVSADPDDNLASPLIDGVLRRNAFRLREILIRDPAVPDPTFGMTPRTIANELGEFTAPVAAFVASLNTALETGTISPDGYVPLFIVSGGRQDPFVGIDNLRGPLFPNQSIIDQRTDQEFHFSFFRDVGTTEWDTALNSWTLQCYHHTRRMLRSLEAMLSRDLKVDQDGVPLFLPVRALHVRPLGLGVSVDDENAYRPAPDELLLSRITVGLSFPGATTAGQERPILEKMVPTWLQHEIGHHIFFHMTRTHDSSENPEGLEEGVADALAVLENKDPRMLYRKDEVGMVLPTSRSFTLEGHQGPDFRDPLRVDVGEAFWRLREVLRVAAGKEDLTDEERAALDPSNAQRLLLAWLGFNRASRTDQRVFDKSQDLFEQLLLVDDARGIMGGDGNIRNGTPRKAQIEEAFVRRGRFMFDAAFKRGDATLDGKVDLSDAISILTFLFGGVGLFHDCLNAMDADDNSQVSISDAIRILGYLFQGRAALPEPFLKCGPDVDDIHSPRNLGCRVPICPF